ncbi:MAG: M1 family metallopeptidase [Gammaproteobacteria bacterium]
MQDRLRYVYGTMLAVGLLMPSLGLTQGANTKSADSDFQQLEYVWPAPGAERLGSGAPGPGYWQQRVDYDIQVELDPASKYVYGTASIRYHNRSPHKLTYIWVQLDQNRFHADSLANRSRTLKGEASKLSYSDLTNMISSYFFYGRMNTTRVASGEQELSYQLVDTMLRIDLPAPLETGDDIVVEIDWWYQMVDLDRMRGRSGYSRFENNELVFMAAQWYPRVAAYTDYKGWQNHSFLGVAEFSLEFGDFKVAITLPDDYLVAATGELTNFTEVLSGSKRKLYVRAQRSKKPVMIYDTEEVRTLIGRKPSTKKKTWQFSASSVRDFAFVASRAFLWDMRGVKIDEQWVSVMSFYPEESAVLWRPYASESAALALEVYSRQTFPYPYPTSVQVNGPVFGMEYPMLTMMSSRPYPDKTYWGAIDPAISETFKYSKYGLISTTIHEVGHNFFPMIVNSDERQWTWMDEGLNTFLQFLTEQEWSKNYPSRRGWIDATAQDMKNLDALPIMSNGDRLRHRGFNAYNKPAVALNVLRELVLGRKVFDFAFKEYARRWKFKRPTPFDFFRTMEDASGQDLDWFWNTWFYRHGYVSVGIHSVQALLPVSGDPDTESALAAEQKRQRPLRLIDARNADIKTLVERKPELRDFYDSYDPEQPTTLDRRTYQKLLDRLTDIDRKLFEQEQPHIYVVELENTGTMITPVPLRIYLQNGASRDILLPAQVWRYNEKRARYALLTEQAVSSVEFDPQRTTADVDATDNIYPRQIEQQRVIPVKQEVPDNPLRKAQ